VATPKCARRVPQIVQQHSTENTENSDKVEIDGGKEQPHQNVVTASCEKMQGKQHVAKRIAKEEALILDEQLQMERYKMEAEETIQKFEQNIRKRKSEVESWKLLLDD